jgi:hypothetical protein
MAFRSEDRVKETTTTTGTSSITLAGAVTGFRTFASAISVSDTFNYCIDNGAGQWEVGIGTLSSSTVMARTTVTSSSNSNALVNFSAGSKTVYITISADIINKQFNNIRTTAVSITLTLNDHTILVNTSPASPPPTITLPTAVGCAGKEYIFKSITETVFNITGQSGQTIEGINVVGLPAKKRSLAVMSDGANWHISQPEDVSRLNGVTLNAQGTPNLPYTGSSLVEATLYASEAPASGIDVSNPSAGNTTVFLDAGSKKLKFVAPLGGYQSWVPGRPIQFTTGRPLWEARKTVTVVRTTANGYTLNADNIIGWTQPSTAALSATVYDVMWVNGVVGYWSVISKTVIDLSNTYLGIEDPATNGPIVCRLKIGSSPDWAHWARTTQFITQKTAVRDAMRGIVVHFQQDFALPDDITSHPLYVGQTAPVTRSHYNGALRTVMIGLGGVIAIASGNIYWTYLHEMCHVFDSNFIEASPVPGAGPGGTDAIILSDYTDFTALHAALRTDTVNVPEYFRNGAGSGTLGPADTITSPTEVDFSRGRKEWFAESMAAWLLYVHPTAADTTVANAQGLRANGTAGRFTAFRAAMDGLGI